MKYLFAPKENDKGEVICFQSKTKKASVVRAEDWNSDSEGFTYEVRKTNEGFEVVRKGEWIGNKK